MNSKNTSEHNFNRTVGRYILIITQEKTQVVEALIYAFYDADSSNTLNDEDYLILKKILTFFATRTDISDTARNSLNILESKVALKVIEIDFNTRMKHRISTTTHKIQSTVYTTLQIAHESE